MHIYFHEDFDGVVSAALVAMYFRDEHHDYDIHFHPVDYDIPHWESRALKSPSCVVDFKYHPNCDYWFDHHSCAKGDINKIREQYADKYKPKDQKLYCDPKTKSCASLIGYKLLLKPFNFMLSDAADYIDSAEYSSVDIACFGQEEEIKLNKIITHRTLSLTQICEDLLEFGSIYDIMKTSKYNEAHKDAWLLECKSFLTYMGASESSETNHIVEYDMFNQGIFNRYLPFWEYPKCEYAIGLIGTNDNISIAVGKNPWNDKPGRLHVGNLCKKLGGGGHEDVGGIHVDNISKADDIYDEIIKELNNCD